MSFIRQRVDGNTTLVNPGVPDVMSPSFRPGSGSRPGSGRRSFTRPGSNAHPLATSIMGEHRGDYHEEKQADEYVPGSAIRVGSATRGHPSAPFELVPAAPIERRPSATRPASAKRGFAVDEDILEGVSTVSEEPLPEEKAPAEVMADEWPSVLADGWKAYFLRTLHDIFLTSWLNVLLACIPVAVIVYYVSAPPAVVFVFSLLSLCPLAERIAFVTDEMAKYTNDTFGGLMSASMGNVTELIVAIVAISSGGSLLIVTQLSLVGSIVSNLLLVLGCAFLAGGYKHPHQRYSKPAVNANIGLLLLATMVIILPTIMTVSRNYNCQPHTAPHATHTTDGDDALSLADPSSLPPPLLLCACGVVVQGSASRRTRRTTT